MAGEPTTLPIALGFGSAIVAFAAIVPWLVHESRRPLRVRVPRQRTHEHRRVTTWALTTRSVVVSILPRHTTPRVVDAADEWRRSFAVGPRRVGVTAVVPVATVRDTGPVDPAHARGRGRSPARRSSPRVATPAHLGHARPHRGPRGRTKQQLYDEARRRNIRGRSTMSKAQLEEALGS